ncbi:hypothetical protein NEPAR06_1051 [Nematocida parisii]|uniref:Uncharacterized protein n=1 Tax=Nematocida parisii (strain ERTm3) TaxID=935791 RepID=I3EGG9_NEMP3|nr:uncharacterized protein NEPG_01189 [Nematocida parisii ERTm1]EIJ88316.1 hypothetical protein NEQG_01760 [Nematocida parisii ERTm3]KAI5142267.1 hypothetical protein NEPAR07_0009 [Nematocida parisii]EIJ93617.1 hypothetical protein NEPG_01189 [Nematocida parisii ERTm1]KAI5154351.1 hypothetical protein NEPAR06_1051 [Nematocida parisii]KAI5158650.1 hypothetical protein NEPAR05_2177 [Nematocida parisii]|eukprot:XP_013059017.1 hypothetical protein NEPG_01189 [Nematocida parisii ERTm1]
MNINKLKSIFTLGGSTNTSMQSTIGSARRKVSTLLLYSTNNLPMGTNAHRYITLGANKPEIKKAVDNIKKEKDQKEAKSHFYMYSPKFLHGKLPRIIARNAKIDISSTVEPVHIDLLNSITEHVLEGIIRMNMVTANGILTSECPITADYRNFFANNDNTQITINKVVENGFLPIVSKRVNAWYAHLLSLPDFDVIEYLTHVRQLFIEHAFINHFNKPIELINLEKFVSMLDEERVDIHGHSINLFERNQNGVYNIDRALELLESNKHNLEIPFCPENSQFYDTLCEQDRNLLLELSKNWIFVKEILSALHKIIDPKNEYVDINYLIGIHSQTEVQRISMKSPADCHVGNLVDRKVLKKYISGRSYPILISEYISDRVNQFRISVENTKPTQYKNFVYKAKNSIRSGFLFAATLIAGSGGILYYNRGVL